MLVAQKLSSLLIFVRNLLAGCRRFGLEMFFPYVESKIVDYLSESLGIWTELCRAMGTLVIARESSVAILGCDEAWRLHHALSLRWTQVLPLQDMKIGSLDFSKVPFFTLASGDSNSNSLGFDGLLTMGLFRRVFICHSNHFAILEPR